MKLRSSQREGRRSAVSFCTAEALEQRALFSVPYYTVTDLGTLPGDNSAVAWGINASGEIVGMSYYLNENNVNGGTHAFLYASGKMTALGTLPGDKTSSAVAINSSGEIVGTSTDASGDEHAFLYSGGKMKALGALPGDTFSTAAAINTSGEIVGTSWSGSNSADGHAFLYSNGKLTAIGTLSGFKYSSAVGINDSGQVAVNASGFGTTQYVKIDGVSAYFENEPFLYSAGKLTALGALSMPLPAGTEAPYFYSETAAGINSAGAVAAYVMLDGYSNGGDAVFSDTGAEYSSGKWTALAGALSPSAVKAINDSGEVVGDSYELTGAAYTSFIYGGGTADLFQSLIPVTSPTWAVSFANGINDSGDVAAEGFLADGSGLPHAIELVPYTGKGVITLTGSGSQFSTVGSSYSFALGSFTEFAATSPFSVDVKWGDGTADTKFTTTTMEFLPNQSHTYTHAGTYTVTVTVSSGSGASGSDTFSAVASAPLTRKLVAVAAFNGVDAEGTTPESGLVRDASGDLYGTTSSDGNDGGGTVFEIPAGTTKVNNLVVFNGTDDDGGITPEGGMVIDAQGNVYGTTSSDDTYGGGTVFKVAAGTHKLTTLAVFNTTTTDDGGMTPTGGLAIDSSGNLYGTTSSDATYNGGTVFKIVLASDKLTTLALFNGTADAGGSDPTGDLLVDKSGNVYGTTSSDATYGGGTVFEIAAGTTKLTTLAVFNGTTDSSAADPSGALAIDSSGNLYGTTVSSDLGGGTVYEIAVKTEKLTTLADFGSTLDQGASDVNGVVIDSAGNLYGSSGAGGAQGYGTIFEIATGTHQLTTLAVFDGSLDDEGGAPVGALLLDSAGDLYGVTSGDLVNSAGTIFELEAPAK